MEPESRKVVARGWERRRWGVIFFAESWLCKGKELWRWVGVVVVRNDVHELNTDLLK